MSEEPRIYLKCTFDCYVALTEKSLKESLGSDIVLLSEIVGKHLANSLDALEEISNHALTLKEGDITTKFISASQGIKRFNEGDKE